MEVKIKQDSTSRYYNVLLLGTGLLLLITIISLPRYFYGWKSSEWPATDGEIIHSGVKVCPGHKKNRSGYVLDMQYRYRIADRFYFGSKISSHEKNCTSRETALLIADDYLVGDKLPIYYNPSNPAEAYLVTGLDAEQNFILYMIMGFLLIEVTLLLLLLIFPQQIKLFLYKVFHRNQSLQ